ncbi:uncharacterized protein G2W53_027832 [Senna tora]|uniref:Uncharacterized protein n=1 Tax=Senna tora TaxID=362788 RepID=A0A834TJE6_9FABA|nr:uncharacterized protein G2W53_027832 [Senna tora]
MRRRSSLPLLRVPLVGRPAQRYQLMSEGNCGKHEKLTRRWSVVPKAVELSAPTSLTARKEVYWLPLRFLNNDGEETTLEVSGTLSEWLQELYNDTLLLPRMLNALFKGL